MAMDEPLRSGRNEILCSGAKRVVRDEHTLISEAPGEAPAGSDVDLLLGVEEGPNLLDQLG
jgi:hypothetical protein